MKKSISVLFLLLSLFSCTKEEVNADDYLGDCSTSVGYASIDDKITIRQGVYGTVHFTQGSCMPSPSPIISTCQTCPVKRKVRIYEYTLYSNAVRYENYGPFLKKINSRVVAEVSTDDNGFFQVNLQPGTYSMVVLEQGKLYATGSDGQGGISPFTVVNGIKQVDFSITYKATF